ncbi:MAG: oxygen-independent coproporphyrinogen III oxidase [Betaproteobacteria bacterium]|nr:oxygen-independent coproporphyrinogen III oxidase [Betaproteobacteria bacterium]
MAKQTIISPHILMGPTVDIDPALLEKYSRPGPRYTSYPTAPYFSEAFGEAAWREEMRTSQALGRDLSLYVHIPFCDTLCYYCGCNMVATRRYERVEPYLQCLSREIQAVAEGVAKDRQVRQLHWGGGTPTYLRPADIERLAHWVRDAFTVAADAEVGCEVDPRELTQGHIEALAAAGFNRLSLGVQDLDARVQQAVNRVQPAALIERVYGWMREAGFRSINMDLMVGLPHQTLESFTQTLDQILAMGPDRLAIFGYAHVPWLKKHQTLIVQSDLPNFETRIALQKLILDRLSQAGYVYIGMDHFARAEDELVVAQRSGTLWRNFQGYTTHRHCDIYAFGVSAISQTDDVYVQNAKKLNDYQRLIGEGRLATERGLRVTRDDKIRRDAITRIMCDLALDKAAFGRQWAIDFDAYFGEALNDLGTLEQDGLVLLTAESIRVTELGRIFLRNIAMPFDAYLKAESAQKPRYSRTV